MSKVVSCIYDLLDLGTSGTWKDDGTVVLNRPPASSKLDKIKFRSFSANILPTISNSSVPNIYGELRANVYQFDNTGGNFNEYSTNNTPMSITINSLNGNKTYTQDEDSILLSTYTTSITDDLESSINNALSVGKVTLGQFLSTNFIDDYRYKTGTNKLTIPDNFYDILNLPPNCPIWFLPTNQSSIDTTTVHKPICTAYEADVIATGYCDCAVSYSLAGSGDITLSVKGCKYDGDTVSQNCSVSSIGPVNSSTKKVAYGVATLGSYGNYTVSYNDSIAPNQFLVDSSSDEQYQELAFRDSFNTFDSTNQTGTNFKIQQTNAVFQGIDPNSQCFYGVAGCPIESSNVQAIMINTGAMLELTYNDYCMIHLFYGPYSINGISYQQSRSLKEFVSRVSANQAYLWVCCGSCADEDSSPSGNYYAVQDISGVLSAFSSYFTSNLSDTQLNNSFILDFSIDTLKGTAPERNHMLLRYVSDNQIGFVCVTFGFLPKHDDPVITAGGISYIKNTGSFITLEPVGFTYQSDTVIASFFSNPDAKIQHKLLGNYQVFTHNAAGYYNIYNNVCSLITFTYGPAGTNYVAPNVTANMVPYNATLCGKMTQNDEVVQLQATQTINISVAETVPITGFMAFYNNSSGTSINPLVPFSSNTPIATLSSSFPYDYYRTYTTSIIVGSTDSSVTASSYPGSTEYPSSNHVKFGSIATLAVDTNTIDKCFTLIDTPDGTTKYSTFVLLTSDNKYAIEFFVSLYTDPDIFEFSRQYAPFSLYDSTGKPIFKNISWELTNNTALEFVADESVKNVSPALVGNVDTYIKLRNSDLTLKLICNDFPTLNNIVFYLNETAMIDFKEAACSPNESVLECRIVDYNGNILVPADASLLYSNIIIAVDWQFY